MIRRARLPWPDRTLQRNRGAGLARRRSLLRSLGACAALLVAMAGVMPAARAEFPDRPIRIVVPYPAGGTTDILARAVATRLTETLHQPVVVENRGGASGGIGSQLVAKSPADGYTLLMATINSHGINAALVPNLPYDPIKDFAPISLVASTPNVLMVNPTLPVHSVAELLALARAQPGTLNFGSTSSGGSPHMSGELLKAIAKIDIHHVPYKGGAPMLTDLIGGQIQMGFDNLPSSIAQIKAGKVRALAVTTTARWPGLPDLPTLAESGVPGYEVSAWFGLLTPAGTPPAIVERLSREVQEYVRLPATRQSFLDQGAEPVGNTSAQFAKVISDEVAKWRKVVESNGVKIE